jgi:hypothetical protein
VVVGGAAAVVGGAGVELGAAVDALLGVGVVVPADVGASVGVVEAGVEVDVVEVAVDDGLEEALVDVLAEDDEAGAVPLEPISPREKTTVVAVAAPIERASPPATSERRVRMRICLGTIGTGSHRRIGIDVGRLYGRAEPSQTDWGVHMD